MNENDTIENRDPAKAEEQTVGEAAEAGAAQAAPAENLDPALEIAQLRDALLRAYAETENVRRRAERQVQDMRSYAIDRFARDLLSVSDNLTRALQSAPAEALGDPQHPLNRFLVGVELTERELVSAFHKHGLTRFGAIADPFDPNLHQAVAQIPSAAPAGSIAEVFQAGYSLADRVLRPAMVAVSLGLAAGQGEPGAPEPGLAAQGEGAASA